MSPTAVIRRIRVAWLYRRGLVIVFEPDQLIHLVLKAELRTRWHSAVSTSPEESRGCSTEGRKLTRRVNCTLVLDFRICFATNEGRRAIVGFES
jgi:hypothetical protein